MSLNGGQQNFVQCLAISYTIYTFSGAVAPNRISRYVQVLRFPILAVLMHGTPAAGVVQTLRRGTRNGITEL